MPLDTTLLDLDRVPTLDELKAFFRKHDWSAAKMSEPKSRDADKVAGMEEIKEIMDAEFEKIVREKGLGAASKYYENKTRVESDGGNVISGQGNPLLELRDSTEDLISDAVYEIAVNHDDMLDEIFSQFDFEDPDFEQKADAFLHNAVGTMLDVMEYEKLAKLIHEMSAFEDFNSNVHPNYRGMEHERSWYHIDTKHPTLPDPDVENLIRQQNPNPADVAISNIMIQDFLKTLDKKDRTILKMMADGYTQAEIAKTLGMANNSGVSKRIAKLRSEFIRKTGINIE